MNPRRVNREHRVSFLRPRMLRVLLAGLFLSAACAAAYYGQRFTPLAAVERDAEPTPAQTPAPSVRREIVEFGMTDLDRGWIRYSDGRIAATDDGGAHWRETSSGITENTVPAAGAWNGFSNEEHKPLTVPYKSGVYPVKQSQFLTDRIGWALPSGGGELNGTLLVTADGGESWHSEVTADVREAMQVEKKRQALIGMEAALYSSPKNAKLAIQSNGLLVPDTAYPGDVILVRQDKPAELAWQGKTYKLQPFGAGYFTYLPIPIQAKPGKYPIGEQTLTIQQKKFETQYLQVTKQMESMRQDTSRIQADQKKIDAARNRSQPEFLFSSAFIQPVEGILTTPYGYTRYTNGKYDSSHLAIDLAAKEGTPIKATNDGIVALADSLYLTGNAIYLDHGMGLFSQYAHLSELRVKTGDRVKRGDIIGLVGTTGFSTGPHLHFAFWAHNVPVNPDLFFNTTPFHWLDRKQ